MCDKQSREIRQEHFCLLRKNDYANSETVAHPRLRIIIAIVRKRVRQNEVHEYRFGIVRRLR